jgi:hypothetical protein
MRPVWLLAALPFLAAGPALLACTSDELETTSGCTLDAPVAAPASGAPGDEVVLTSAPLTEVWDTLVTVGGTRATVLDLTRDGCDDCDTCVDDAECTVCDVECVDCTETCATCVETVTIVVPDLPAGDHAVQVVNRHGTSELGTLTVLAGADTGDTDTGADTGDTDTGVDTGDTDTGVDTGDTDTGDTDTGDTDTGVDTGVDTADTSTDTGA